MWATGIPIVVVPSTLTSLLTLFNAKDFLENAVFVPSMEKKSSGARKENMVVVNRQKGKDQFVQYHVVDNTSKFTSTEW